MSYSNNGYPNSPRPNGDPSEVPFHPEVDQILEQLSHYRRRVILFLLNEGEIDTLEDVLRHEGIDTETTEIELIHHHLPELQNANYIEFDQDTGEISKGPCFDQVVSLLELVAQHADEWSPD